MPAGRKPLYDIKSLKIGEKLRLPTKIQEFRHQYLRNFNDSGAPMKFELEQEDKKYFVKRVA